MKTKQEIFDQVVNHLLAQGATAITDDGVCQYKDAKGRKCAAGCLLDDRFYNEQMEGLTVGSAIRDQYSSQRAKLIVEAFISSGVDLNNPEVEALIDRLQTIHDGGNPLHWCSLLETESSKHQLQFNYAKETTAQAGS